MPELLLWATLLRGLPLIAYFLLGITRRLHARSKVLRAAHTAPETAQEQWKQMVIMRLQGRLWAGGGLLGCQLTKSYVVTGQ